LEEMTGRRVPEAALFVTSERRRVGVSVDDHRLTTEAAIDAARSVLLEDNQATVAPRRSLCRSCSVQEACQPELGWFS
jgi:CRISPR-associated exonuclease Cas4